MATEQEVKQAGEECTISLKEHIALALAAGGIGSCQNSYNALLEIAADMKERFQLQTYEATGQAAAETILELQMLMKKADEAKMFEQLSKMDPKKLPQA